MCVWGTDDIWDKHDGKLLMAMGEKEGREARNVHRHSFFRAECAWIEERIQLIWFANQTARCW